jgi:hypothetical protein
VEGRFGRFRSGGLRSSFGVRCAETNRSSDQYSQDIREPGAWRRGAKIPPSNGLAAESRRAGLRETLRDFAGFAGTVRNLRLG